MSTVEELRALKVQKLEAEIESLRLENEKRKHEADWNRLQVAGAEIKYADALASSDFHHIFHFFGHVGPTRETSYVTASECIETTGQWSRRDPGCDITIVLNSPGGDIVDGLAIYDHLIDLRRRGHKITTIARGMAASMGGVLLQAGDERIIDKNAVMLVHDGQYGLVGKGFEVKDRVKFIEMLQEKLYTILAERSILSPQEIAARCDRKDWWMSAQEALDLGFVDRLET